MVYLPTKLGDLCWANVGIHIPAPWSIWDTKPWFRLEVENMNRWMGLGFPSHGTIITKL